jgi:hypothetical protein
LETATTATTASEEEEAVTRPSWKRCTASDFLKRVKTTTSKAKKKVVVDATTATRKMIAVAIAEAARFTRKRTRKTLLQMI